MLNWVIDKVVPHFLLFGMVIVSLMLIAMVTAIVMNVLNQIGAIC